VAFGAFLANPKVTVERLIESWSELTRAAVAGRHVLAIQDTSEIHFSTRPQHRRGLGDVGKGNARGVLAHVMVAVDADNGACLGLLAGAVYNRKSRVSTPHAKRALKDKESKRWGETVQAAKPAAAAARVVTGVADRESDIYHYWASAPGPNFHLLTRMMHDRAVAGGGTAWKKTADWPFVARREVELAATSGRAARKATLSLRFGEVTIRRPDGADMKSLPKTMTLRLVEAVERDPPAGVEPVQWRLLTTHAVEEVATAWQIVDWYRMRWIIEQLFRLMKSQGLQLEDSQIETAGTVRNLVCGAG
jgi:Transposase DDE domain